MATATWRIPAGVPVPEDTSRPVHKSLLKRFIAALMESRKRQAEAEIARHRHLLPDELEHAAWRLTPRTEDQLPFVR